MINTVHRSSSQHQTVSDANGERRLIASAGSTPLMRACGRRHR
jgi:hypothetical protein